MQATHLELQHLVAGMQGTHLLSAPLAAMDFQACRQKSLTALCDARETERVTTIFRGLRFRHEIPGGHREAVLWEQLDSFSSAWVTASGEDRFTPSQFREMAAIYFF